MTPRIEKQETYREHLSRIAQSLAAGHNTDVFENLAAGSTPAQVKLFTDGNFDKRREKLSRQVESVAGAFPDFDDLLERFIHEIPLAAYDTGADDGERFLQWLEQTQKPTDEQRDYIGCQRGRHAVEDAARRNRLAHVRFQDLLGLAGGLADELDKNRSLVVYLNPMRVWTRFETRELLDESATLPAEVVFFPVAGDIHTAVLEGEGLDRIRELASFGPCTLDAWLRKLDHYVVTECVGRSALATFCRELSEMGLVAFG
ncbi:MAG: hypothetical protein EXS05_22060 [Planctomycetaceae bacterium]|nr:hypothetical protein [Planctomycetaceae bacterium]